jgi:hypothetical protein
MSSRQVSFVFFIAGIAWHSGLLLWDLKLDGLAIYQRQGKGKERDDLVEPHIA